MTFCGGLPIWRIEGNPLELEHREAANKSIVSRTIEEWKSSISPLGIDKSTWIVAQGHYTASKYYQGTIYTKQHVKKRVSNFRFEIWEHDFSQRIKSFRFHFFKMENLTVTFFVTGGGG